MSKHLVVTDDETTPRAIGEALEVANIKGQAQTMDLERLAQLAAALIAEYPPGEQAPARARLHHMIDEHTSPRG